MYAVVYSEKQKPHVLEWGCFRWAVFRVLSSCNRRMELMVRSTLKGERVKIRNILLTRGTTFWVSRRRKIK